MLEHEKPLHIIGVGFLLIAVEIIAITIYFDLPDRSINQQIACTQEAKLCPDGSSVGRTGPNCEFTECAKTVIAQIDTSDWKTYRNEEYGFEVKYPTDWELYEGYQATGHGGFPSPSREQKIYNISFKKTNEITHEKSPPITLQTNSFFISFYENMPEELLEQQSDEGTRIRIAGFDAVRIMSGIGPTERSESVTFLAPKERFGISMQTNLRNLPREVFYVNVPSEIKDHFEQYRDDAFIIFNQILSTFKFIDKNAINASALQIPEKYKEYVNKACSSYEECGGFPCIEQRCFVKACTNDSQCPNTLCGLNLTPTPGFCTITDDL